jgi:hypothetical protein
MPEKRESIRCAASAKIRINTYTETFVLSCDISRRSCCTSYPNTLSISGIVPDTIREYILLPKIGAAKKLKLIIQLCRTWIEDRMRETNCRVAQFPTQKNNEKFIACLAWQICRK